MTDIDPTRYPCPNCGELDDHAVGCYLDSSSLEEAFATFGIEVSPNAVPALVEAGLDVWSFGYGDDPEAFTTIGLDDLWAWQPREMAGDVVRSWAPFRVDPAALKAAARRV